MSTALTPYVAAPKRRGLVVAMIAAVVVIVAAIGLASWLGPSASHQSPQWPNLSNGITAVTCADAKSVDGEFTRAVQDATTSANYDGVRKFGFSPPTKVEELKNFQLTLKTRQGELDAKATAVTNGTCVDGANGTGTPTAGPCPEQFVQHFDPNINGRFVSNGVTDSKAILAAAGHDARYLAFLANQRGLLPNASADKLLAPDNKCLSREGQDASLLLQGSLFNNGVQINENDQVPANYYNTGMIGGHPVVDQSPGIGGNRAAVSFTDKQTGKKFYVMQRCGNVGKENQQGLPPGNTEHERPPGSTPPPPPETTTPPTSPPTTSTCTNGDTSPKCLEHKIPAQGCANGTKLCASQGGTNPPAPTTVEPRPSNPPTSYNPNPTTTHTQPAPTRTSVPPVETAAPQPSAPATGVQCPPGIPNCDK